MTALPGQAAGGWTRTGEVIRRPVGGRYPDAYGEALPLNDYLASASQEERIMAANTKDRDEPLALGDEPRRPGPRDALTGDYDPDVDYVPDLAEKGYHSGQTRQPAEAVPAGRGADPAAVLVDPSTGARYVLESTTDLPSKFTEDPGALKRLKEAHNKVEATAEWQRSVRAAEPVPAVTREEALGLANAGGAGAASTRADQPAKASRSSSASSKASGKATVTTPDADAGTAKVDDSVTGNPANEGKG